MTPVQASSTRVAWSAKRQSAFGAPLAGAELDRFLKLQRPLIVNDNAELWSDRGAVGSGHDWAEQRGRTSQMTEFAIPDQPLPVDFIGFLAGLLFSAEEAAITSGGANRHTASFRALDVRPEAWVTTMAVAEDGADLYVQDIACSELKISGRDSERLNAGGAFLAGRIGGTLAGYSWPESAPLRYLYNYAGAFSIDGDSGRRSQLRSFELSLNSGINTDLAWSKSATEAERIFPSRWLYSPRRELSLSLSMIAESGDLAAFRAAQQQAAPMEVVISCLGEPIAGTSPQESDLLEITVPGAVFTSVDYSYDGGLMVLELSAEGNYDAATGGPVSIRTVEGSVAQYLTT